MIFTRAQVDRLVQGKTVQVRKLVKEGDYYREAGSVKVNNKTKEAEMYILPTVNRGEKKYWQVGRKYTVQYKGKNVLYCPKCNKIPEKIEPSTALRIDDELKRPAAKLMFELMGQIKSEGKKLKATPYYPRPCCFSCDKRHGTELKPLYIIIKSISRKHLFDILTNPEVWLMEVVKSG